MEELTLFLTESVTAGTEGLIVKSLESTYEPSKCAACHATSASDPFHLESKRPIGAATRYCDCWGQPLAVCCSYLAEKVRFVPCSSTAHTSSGNGG